MFNKKTGPPIGSRRSFLKVVRSREPLHALADRVLDERTQQYEALIMPLSSDGERVDMLLVGLIYNDENR